MYNILVFKYITDVLKPNTRAQEITSYTKEQLMHVSQIIESGHTFRKLGHTEDGQVLG